MKNLSTLGKVIKYEFKHSARIILPLYGVLLTLGLLTGLSINGKKYEQIVSDSLETTSNGFYLSYSGDSVGSGIITGLLILAVTVLTVAVTVVTIVTLARRFKESMLGEEAYLNLSLPATMTEQLGGRLIMDILWLLCGAIVIFLAFILCFIRINLIDIFNQARESIPEMKQFFAEQNISFAKFFLVQILFFISIAFWLITIIFVVNAISHLLKNQKGFIKLLIVVGLLFISGKVSNIFNPVGPTSLETAAAAINLFIKASFILSIENLCWAAIYFGFTLYVFSNKLNLE